MLLNDNQIAYLSSSPIASLTEQESQVLFHDEKYIGDQGPMISPFVPTSISQTDGVKHMSYGVSSVGYDVKLKDHFLLMTTSNRLIDPRQPLDEHFTTVEGKGYVDIPPGGFVLAVTEERFIMPRTVAGIVLTKSSHARAGLICLATPLEPGWTGYITMEYANHTHNTIRLWAGEGSAQVLFMLTEPPKVAYSDRHGKYQNQPQVPVTPKLK